MNIMNPHLQDVKFVVAQIDERLEEGKKIPKRLFVEYRKEMRKLATWRWSPSKGEFYIKRNDLEPVVKLDIQKWKQKMERGFSAQDLSLSVNPQSQAPSDSR